MSAIIAVDPGSTESAFVVFDGVEITSKGKWANSDLLATLRCVDSAVPVLVLEKIASYGMAVGSEVFETVYWSGRFHEAFAKASIRNDVHRLERLKVKLHLCHNSRAKDANIRQALIDRFGEVGTKKQPGPLYGVSKDIWAALAVAVTWWDQNRVSMGGAA